MPERVFQLPGPIRADLKTILHEWARPLRFGASEAKPAPLDTHLKLKRKATVYAV